MPIAFRRGGQCQGEPECAAASGVATGRGGRRPAGALGGGSGFAARGAKELVARAGRGRGGMGGGRPRSAARRGAPHRPARAASRRFVRLQRAGAQRPARARRGLGWHQMPAASGASDQLLSRAAGARRKRNARARLRRSKRRAEAAAAAGDAARTRRRRGRRLGRIKAGAGAAAGPGGATRAGAAQRKPRHGGGGGGRRAVIKRRARPASFGARRMPEGSAAGGCSAGKGLLRPAAG